MKINILHFFHLTQSERAFNASYTGGFGEPECWKIDIPVKGENLGHIEIIQNWIDAISKGSPLLAPGEEGVKVVELVNAIYLSSWLNQTVELPIDANIYLKKLQEKMNQSTFQ
ncbi:hypothetical protein R4Z09_15585 [Niallia oryzisoli]|uniref:Uncharacterized protein n=1 Tax=Niallia oryzisoli TaxID=1737571 RepID=A0ABZ2CQS8_9BACI